MMIKIRQVSGSTLCGFRHQTLLHKHNPPTSIPCILIRSKEKEGFQPLSSHVRLRKFGNGSTKRKYIVCSVEPGASPSGPPSNILSWVVAVAIAVVVVPFINYKWGPLLKKKVEAAMQTAEDVAEAVEKVAEEVEEAAEDIADNLPEDGRLRKAVDFVEKIAERTAMDAEAVDQFIDKVQEEEEKAESLIESVDDKSEKPPKDPEQVKPKDQK